MRVRRHGRVRLRVRDGRYGRSGPDDNEERSIDDCAERRINHWIYGLSQPRPVRHRLR